MPKRFCLDCGALFDMDSTGTQRCPTHQTAVTARRNQRPSSSARGYDGEYQRNKATVIEQARNGRPCVICHEPITSKATVEHIKPLREGGTSDLTNLGPAHSDCNTAWNKSR